MIPESQGKVLKSQHLFLCIPDCRFDLSLLSYLQFIIENDTKVFQNTYLYTTVYMYTNILVYKKYI